MDCRIRTSRVRRLAIHDWRIGVESGDQEFATIVSVSVFHNGTLLSPLSRDSLVSMMSFMTVLWWLVPAAPRRVD